MGFFICKKCLRSRSRAPVCFITAISVLSHFNDIKKKTHTQNSRHLLSANHADGLGLLRRHTRAGGLQTTLRLARDLLQQLPRACHPIQTSHLRLAVRSQSITGCDAQSDDAEAAGSEISPAWFTSSLHSQGVTHSAPELRCKCSIFQFMAIFSGEWNCLHSVRAAAYVAFIIACGRFIIVLFSRTTVQ